MEENFIFSSFFMFMGILEVLFAIPLIYMKIPPNKIYGFRIRETLNDKQLWYDVNSYCGRDLLLSGIIVFIGGIMVLLLNMEFFISMFIGLWFVIIPLIIITLRSYLFIRKQRI